MKRVNRKLEMIKTMRDELDAVKNEVEQARVWIKEKNAFLANPPPLGFEARAAEERIQLFKVFFNRLYFLLTFRLLFTV